MFRDDTFLARWLSGNLSAAEREAFEQNPEYLDYSRLIQYVDKLKTPLFDQDVAFQRLLGKLSPKKATQRPVFQLGWLKIAAAIALFVLAYWSLTPPSSVTIHNTTAQKKDISLPDNSHVLLHGGSTLHYNPKRWSRERSLDLQGEAFFKVKSGSKFTVLGKGGKVEVVGTSFNVITLDSALAVQCYTGKVRVIDVNAQERQFVLNPGDFVQLHATNNKLLQYKIAALPIVEQGESSFYDASFEEVLTKIENQFSVVIPDKEEYQTRHFTGAFPNKNLELALKLVCIPMELQYSIKNRQVLLEKK
jgi:ferric-dicitrate binding protein FerR (iron transport regulator)